MGANLASSQWHVTVEKPEQLILGHLLDQQFGGFTRGEGARSEFRYAFVEREAPR